MEQKLQYTKQLIFTFTRLLEIIYRKEKKKEKDNETKLKNQLFPST